MHWYTLPGQSVNNHIYIGEYDDDDRDDDDDDNDDNKNNNNIWHPFHSGGAGYWNFSASKHFTLWLSIYNQHQHLSVHDHNHYTRNNYKIITLIQLNNVLTWATSLSRAAGAV